MPWLFFNLAALSITALFFIYRKTAGILAEQRRKLRKRVAYMLWTAAQQSR